MQEYIAANWDKQRDELPVDNWNQATVMENE